jgi:hypothetical protein
MPAVCERLVRRRVFGDSSFLAKGGMMKAFVRGILFAAWMGLPLIANAGEWVFIANLVEGSSLFYLDTGSAFRRGDTATVPVRTAAGQKDMLDVNCAGNSITAKKSGKTMPVSADPAVKIVVDKACRRFFEFWK